MIIHHIKILDRIVYRHEYAIILRENIIHQQSYLRAIFYMSTYYYCIRKMNKHIVVEMVLIVVIMVLASLTYSYFSNSQTLMRQLDSKNTEIVVLSNKVDDISKNYSVLQSKYVSVKQYYENVKNAYANLEYEYGRLEEKYGSLQENYSNLSKGGYAEIILTFSHINMSLPSPTYYEINVTDGDKLFFDVYNVSVVNSSKIVIKVYVFGWENISVNTYFEAPIGRQLWFIISVVGYKHHSITIKPGDVVHIDISPY